MTTPEQSPFVHIPSHRAPDGYHLDRATFLSAHTRFLELLARPKGTMSAACADLFHELSATGMDPDRARHYMWAAQAVWEDNLDPNTGKPLTGIASLDPVKVDEAVKLLCEIMPEYMREESAEWLANRAVTALADAGWKPVA